MSSDERFDMREDFAEVRGEIRHLDERFDRLAHALMVAGFVTGGGAFAVLAVVLVALG